MSDKKRGSFVKCGGQCGRKEVGTGHCDSNMHGTFIPHHGGGVRGTEASYAEDVTGKSSGISRSYIFIIPGRGVQDDLQASGSGAPG